MEESTRKIGIDFGLFILRTMVGLMMVMGHGWPKLANFSAKAANFPDPLGISSSMSLILAVGAEFFCGLLVIVGLATRLAAIPLIITMATAAFVVHAGDGYAEIEPALLFMVPFITLLFAGPGDWSVDAWMDRYFGESEDLD
jgi:putative oxidoreductase